MKRFGWSRLVKVEDEKVLSTRISRRVSFGEAALARVLSMGLVLDFVRWAQQEILVPHKDEDADSAREHSGLAMQADLSERAMARMNREGTLDLNLLKKHYDLQNRAYWVENDDDAFGSSNIIFKNTAVIREESGELREVKVHAVVCVLDFMQGYDLSAEVKVWVEIGDQILSGVFDYSRNDRVTRDEKCNYPKPPKVLSFN